MLKAFLRLALITFGIGILTVLAVVFVRSMGYRQEFAAPPHPWMELSQWNLYQSAPEKMCDGLPKSLKIDMIRVVQVKHLEDTWQVPCGPRPQTLEQVLTSNPETKWLIRVESTDVTHLDNLVDIVNKSGSRKSFAAASASQRVIRYLRKKAPQWLFAADPATMIRMHIFAQMWLESAFDFWPDFVLATDKEPYLLQPREFHELERRKKRIVWNAIDSANASSLSTQGVLTNNPAF